MSRKLLFLTAEFPFGTVETFIENELPYLEEAFDEITIVSLSPNSEQTRFVGKNTRIQRVPIVLNRIDKLLALRWLLHADVLREILRIITVYRLFPSLKRILTALLSWERAHQIQQQLQACIHPDSIGYAYWTDDTALALAMLKKNNPNFKAVSRFHGWDVYFEASSIKYLPFRSFIVSKLDQLVAISQKGHDYALNKWKISAKEKFTISRLGTRQLKETLSIRNNTPEKKVVVSCSNVIPLKRVDWIYDVLNALENHTIKWVHFGDGELLEALKKRVDQTKRVGLEVEFRGRVSNEEVLKSYSQLNPWLFINLSTTEGIPVSIMEACSMGIPVVATAVGGTPEIVSEDLGELVAPDATLQQLTIKVAQFLNLSLEEWKVKAKAAYFVWQKDYHAEKNFKRFAKQIAEL